ncbi:hypothetical protein KUV65_00055 [Maritalea mobilis]|uniref:hypothetical protein n=1 Tax=Maritalea mobilis TaxID=483324 RepID=UPI001C975FD9|nr:hypothetical protein [Maritalea mobilis]MBY6199739.1 hypothetical protein [Maritalea mobilis]
MLGKSTQWTHRPFWAAGTGTGMPHRKSDAAEAIKARFGTVWPAHLSAFTTLLINLRTCFDGDLDLMLVLAVIAERTRPDEWHPEIFTYRQLTRDEAEGGPLMINLQSIAEYSGIPRETVRRKINILVDKEWVVRDGNGMLSVSKQAATDLEDATGHSVTYLSVLWQAFHAEGT